MNRGPARYLAAAGLAAIAVLAAVRLGDRARQWNDELALRSPLADVPPRLDDPHTPRLARHVVLIIVDGLGAGESHLPFLDELRRRGVDAVAHVPYPTISRPNYVTILTGVPPRDSGVRANRVTVPVAVDTVMDRARAAGLRVATASDFGLLASLFLRNTRSLGVGYIEDGPDVHPPPPITWPVDEARRVRSLDELGPTIVELATRDAALVPVLVIDVDRAGHAAGVGTRYRAAAAAVDRMLRGVAAGLDPTRDTIVVTADHGHVAPGGHGGTEPEVSTVPLVIAGAGVVAGATARNARLVDIAPTVAALLGVPAPGHAEGRTLVELLALDRDAAARRLADDETRTRAIDTVLAARSAVARPDPVRLVFVLAMLVLGVGIALVLRHRGVIAIPRGALAGTVALVAIPVAMIVVTRGHASPSYIPTLARVEELGAIGAGIAIVLQLAACWLAVRRARDRLAAANGVALVGLALALGLVGLVRAWFSPPFVDVPSPFWMVAIPTLDLAAATCSAATALALAAVAVQAVRSVAGPDERPLAVTRWNGRCIRIRHESRRAVRTRRRHRHVRRDRRRGGSENGRAPRR